MSLCVSSCRTSYFSCKNYVKNAKVKQELWNLKLERCVVFGPWTSQPVMLMRLLFPGVWVIQIINTCIWLFSFDRWNKSVHWRERGRRAGWRLLSIRSPMCSGSDWGLPAVHWPTGHGCHKPAVQPQRLHG